MSVLLVESIALWEGNRSEADILCLSTVQPMHQHFPLKNEIQSRA